MALINCPECDEEISDQAKACPKCGFDFEFKRRIDEIDKELEKDFQEYVENLKPPKMISSLNEIPRYKNEDSATAFMTIFGVLGGFLTLGVVFFGMDIDLGFTGYHFGMICGAIFLLGLTIYSARHSQKLLKDEQRKIQDEIDNFETIKQNKIESYAASLEERRSRLIKNIINPKPIVNVPFGPTIPHCPTCGSTRIKKISGISKAGSVAIWGVFAVGRVNRQWKCNNCGSEW